MVSTNFVRALMIALIPIASFVPGLRGDYLHLLVITFAFAAVGQLFSAAGGVAWAIVIGAVGFALGSNWAPVERLIGYLGAGGLAIVAVIIVAVLLLRRRAVRI